jgi:hypothetical protein
LEGGIEKANSSIYNLAFNIELLSLATTIQAEHIALTGQTPAQVPQLMHLFGSMAYLPAAAAMAATGQIPAQVPHAMHLLGSIL